MKWHFTILLQSQMVYSPPRMVSLFLPPYSPFLSIIEEIFSRKFMTTSNMIRCQMMMTLIVMLPVVSDFYGQYIMSDKVCLLADKCCQCSVASVHFGCEINCCAELHVGKENCVKSLEKVNSLCMWEFFPHRLPLCKKQLMGHLKQWKKSVIPLCLEIM